MVFEPDLSDEGNTHEKFRGRESQAEGRTSIKALGWEHG